MQPQSITPDAHTQDALEKLGAMLRRVKDVACAGAEAAMHTSNAADWAEAVREINPRLAHLSDRQLGLIMVGVATAISTLDERGPFDA